MLRAVPPFSVERVVDRARVDLAQGVFEVLSWEPEDGIDELVQKLGSLAFTAEVAIRELGELEEQAEEPFSDRPGLPQ